jgi:DNA-binding transcriptional ArsR family regulator
MDDLQIIAEPRRRTILQMVWSEERSAGEIADQFDVTFGAVSQHLAVLRNAGFVDVRKDGTRRFYRANHGRIGTLRPVLESMWAATLDELARAVEAE